MEEMRNPYKMFFQKPEGKKPVGTPRHCGKIILELILGDVGWESVK
jgi:hypothetical protein